MPHPTDPPAVAEALATMDNTLARILTEPSWTQRLGHATAKALEVNCFLVINGWLLTEAINTAIEQVLAGIPGIVAGQATGNLHRALPQARVGETAGEYALRLRAVAAEL